MSRRSSVGALVLSLFVLVAPPAAAKGPTEVEVHDLRTGATALLDFTDRGEMAALEELVGWPEGQREPLGVGRGVLVHVATLTWQLGDDMVAWIDRIYSDDTGRAWVERRDHLSGSGSVSWGRVSGYAFHAVLSQIQEDAEGTTATLGAPAEPTRDPATLVAPKVESTPDPGRQASAGFDAASFGWGAGLTVLLATGLGLIARRRRSWSTRAAQS
jgi:hypothetical protein